MPTQGKASLLLRIEAVETAGAALNAAPDEPERAVRKVLSFDRRSTPGLAWRHAQGYCTEMENPFVGINRGSTHRLPRQAPNPLLAGESPRAGSCGRSTRSTPLSGSAARVAAGAKLRFGCDRLLLRPDDAHVDDGRVDGHTCWLSSRGAPFPFLKASLGRLIVLLEFEPRPRGSPASAVPAAMSVRAQPAQRSPRSASLPLPRFAPFAVRGEAARESGKPNRGSAQTIRRAETPRHGRASQTSRGHSLRPRLVRFPFINRPVDSPRRHPSSPIATRRQRR
jgi:hypothetical protein